jgi:hypothetical protein
VPPLTAYIPSADHATACEVVWTNPVRSTLAHDEATAARASHEYRAMLSAIWSLTPSDDHATASTSLNPPSSRTGITTDVAISSAADAPRVRETDPRYCNSVQINRVR